MHILIDMDGVIADWGKQWDTELDTWFPESKAPRHREQTSFDLKAGLDTADREVVDRVMARPGFYADLEPIDGAVSAIHEMVAAGHSVNICTTPWLPNPTCAQDKLDWLNKHVGAGWSSRAVITTDKTRIRGDFIIDDKPEIHGDFEPEWEHILFHQPYNVTVEKRRIRDWSEWAEVIR